MRNRGGWPVSTQTKIEWTDHTCGAGHGRAGGLEVVDDRYLCGIRAGVLDGEAAQVVVRIALAGGEGGDAVQVGLAALDAVQAALGRTVHGEVIGDQFALAAEFMCGAS
jgi:hypothetical protein